VVGPRECAGCGQIVLADVNVKVLGKKLRFKIKKGKPPCQEKERLRKGSPRFFHSKKDNSGTKGKYQDQKGVSCLGGNNLFGVGDKLDFLTCGGNKERWKSHRIP